MFTNEFKHVDKLQAIALCENNSQSSARRKSITVQHFNDAGQPDSPAELVTTEVGHSPVEITAINGGYYLAKEQNTEPGQAQYVTHGQQQNQGQYQQR
jgi:hypothetical protein